MLANEAVVVRDALDLSISESAELVRSALEAKGLETPMVSNGLSDEQKRYVVKFYRPQRWTNEQILEEHAFSQALADAAIGARDKNGHVCIPCG